MNNIVRCEWAGSDPLMIDYHDHEWGVPCHDDRKLFEMLILEGAQAGLSWMTVLKKRENYREALAGFDPHKVSEFSDVKIEELIKNPGLIRHRLKINSAVKNARVFLEVVKGFGSFSNYLWGFVGGVPIQNAFDKLEHLPPSTELSNKMSKDLKKRGFNFVGPTICYALMQSVGLVNDHTTDCFRYTQVQAARQQSKKA